MKFDPCRPKVPPPPDPDVTPKGSRSESEFDPNLNPKHLYTLRPRRGIERTVHLADPRHPAPGADLAYNLLALALGSEEFGTAAFGRTVKRLRLHLDGILAQARTHGREEGLRSVATDRYLGERIEGHDTDPDLDSSCGD